MTAGSVGGKERARLTFCQAHTLALFLNLEKSISYLLVWVTIVTLKRVEAGEKKLGSSSDSFLSVAAVWGEGENYYDIHLQMISEQYLADDASSRSVCTCRDEECGAAACHSSSSSIISCHPSHPRAYLS